MAAESKRSTRPPITEAQLFYSPEAQTAVTNYGIAFKKMLERKHVPSELIEKRDNEGIRPIVRVRDANALEGSLMPPIVEHAVIAQIGRTFHEPMTIHFSETSVDFLSTQNGQTTGIHFDLFDEARLSPAFVDGLTTALTNALQKPDTGVFFEYKPRLVAKINGLTQPNKAA